ncbi:MAG TPA: response regulator [Blastocatellia bacterium]|nr:response regulator [Blastocatellia bacterium]
MATKILLVEDTPETRDILTILLEIQGFDVVVANNGYEGIKNAFSERPDIIITDLTMPRMNGVEMIKVLRSMPGWQNVPILAVTAYGMEMEQKAIMAGANRAMAQPVEAELLIGYIKDLLKQKRPRTRKASRS